MDPKAFVAGMSALGAGMAMIAGLGPGIGEGYAAVLRNRPSAGGAGRYHPYHDPWYRNGRVHRYLRAGYRADPAVCQSVRWPVLIGSGNIPIVYVDWNIDTSTTASL